MVQRILEAVEYDEVVFLGDWFDSFFEPPKVSSMLETCDYLKGLMTEHPDRDRFTFLVGNHDMQYIYLNKASSRTNVVPVRQYYCSGFSKNKARDFRKIFFDNGMRDDFFLSKFKAAYRAQGVTFTHAGVVPSHFAYGDSIDDLVTRANDALKDFRNFSNGDNYLLTDVGQCRGGQSMTGGLLWLDARDEFFPSEMAGKQVFGHTHHGGPRFYASNTGMESWCIDSYGAYAMVENREISVMQVELPHQ